MGLTLSAKGFNEKIDIGYLGFLHMRIKIAEAYSNECGNLYKEILKNFRSENIDYLYEKWDTICNEDLDLLLWHSDCGGKLTSQECRKISRVLKTLDVKISDRDIRFAFKCLERMLEHCAKKRVMMRFS